MNAEKCRLLDNGQKEISNDSLIKRVDCTGLEGCNQMELSPLFQGKCNTGCSQEKVNVDATLKKKILKK